MKSYEIIWEVDVNHHKSYAKIDVREALHAGDLAEGHRCERSLGLPRPPLVDVHLRL